MHEFTLVEAQKKLPELVDEALSGEDVVIKKDDHTAVRLAAVANSGKPQFGSAKGLIEISSDFDAPLPDFEPYS
ncbi:MAG: hypothetical protein WAM70_02905 [Pyrinomonadaceae bacterium]